MTGDFYHSAELRWFLPGGDNVDSLMAWFRQQDRLPLLGEDGYDPQAMLLTPFVKTERPRSDEYLLLPGCDTVGVKQRQGKLEIKSLVLGPQPFLFERVIGRREQWLKWSFNPSKEELKNGSFLNRQLEMELDQSGPWRRVEKHRSLQKYTFDSGQPIAVSPDQRPETGCIIELTLINVKARIGTWLTLGFEAFGSPEQVMPVLSKSVAHFFAVQGLPPVALEGRDSFSYPAWLALLA